VSRLTAVPKLWGLIWVGICLLGCRPTVPLELQRGAWRLDAVDDGKGFEPVGRGRFFLEFDDASITIFVCAYRNDADLPFYEDLRRDCPFDIVNRRPAVRLSGVGKDELTYRVPEWTAPRTGFHQGTERSSGRPYHWPLLSSHRSTYRIDGDDLMVTNEGDTAPPLRAALRLKRVPRDKVRPSGP
jgi:hypothetical protein